MATHSRKTFEELKQFLAEDMKMQQVYQPVLIQTLIESGGTATVRQLAQKFLSLDESQLDYYERRLKGMPIPVLKRHGIVDKDGILVSLNAKGTLTVEQRAELIGLCQIRLQRFVAERGLAIWDYRMMEGDPVPDSVRYRVLKEAEGRCALCGATRDDAPLHVDHIVPRNKGGSNDYENLQVLCQKCNTSKRDQDDTDFRRLPAETDEDCLFCGEEIESRIVNRVGNAFAIKDRFPVTSGHHLVIPRRHFADYFQSTSMEIANVHDLLRVTSRHLREEDSSIEGFNIGVNSGSAAGQTIPHCHFHLIPRRSGDTEIPEGGVRGAVPGMMSYT